MSTQFSNTGERFYKSEQDDTYSFNAASKNRDESPSIRSATHRPNVTNMNSPLALQLSKQISQPTVKLQNILNNERRGYPYPMPVGGSFKESPTKGRFDLEVGRIPSTSESEVGASSSPYISYNHYHQNNLNAASPIRAKVKHIFSPTHQSSTPQRIQNDEKSYVTKKFVLQC